MTKLKTGNPEGFQGKNRQDRGRNGSSHPEIAGTWEGNMLPSYVLESAARTPNGIALRTQRNRGYVMHDPDLPKVRAAIEMRRERLTDVSL